MEMNENLFDVAGTEATPVEPANAAKDAKKAKIAQMKEDLHATIAEDPTYVSRLRLLSDTLEVVNTLGFGENGNIVVDKTKTEDGRSLIPTSQIVGYRVRNNGSEELKYKTEVWAKGEDGVWTATKTEAVLAPGATADLTRQYMTMLCAIPEISFQLANGKISKGSGASKGTKDIKAELESYYFSFSKDENGVRPSVNADEVKINVGVKGADGQWTVRDEFAAVFGFLNNPKSTGKGGRRTKGTGSSFNAQDLVANHVARMLAASENM